MFGQNCGDYDECYDKYYDECYDMMSDMMSDMMMSTRNYFIIFIFYIIK